MNESIFGLLARKRAPSAQPPQSAGSVAALGQSPRKQSWSASSDVALIAILEAPLRDDETAVVGFARKEAELRHVMASLTVLEAYTMKSRLSCPKPGDQLAEAFMRLTADRRARLINFLADARRREALGSASSGRSVP